jgi:hypothetical protein
VAANVFSTAWVMWGKRDARGRFRKELPLLCPDLDTDSIQDTQDFLPYENFTTVQQRSIGSRDD